ncbi:MAG: HzsA-related protein, partial [Planctomycetota bacterium]
STREPKFCMCNRHIMANLFRMDADGGNIHQIGKSTLHEAHASLMPDGRIIYDRWEYVDRNFGDAQGLWTVNPDGTNHSIYYGNNTLSPGGVIDARIIPGTQQVLCIFSSCHDRPWGALAIVDRRLGIDNAKPVVRLWPERAYDLIGGYGGSKPVPLKYRKRYAFDNMLFVTPKYEDPYPLNDKYFLCSRMTMTGEEGETGVFLQNGTYLMGIYLVDIFGNEVLLHTEEPGCYDPMPIKARARPPIVPSRRNFDNSEGYLYVADVYNGTGMNNVKRGQVKYLRVVESPEKRFWTNREWEGQGIQCPGMNWHNFENKRILGTVPVEEDGSAYFAVPSDKFVYFQLLDANEMMIQSMRSGTIVQSGETTGCVGCHENRRSSPQALKKSPKALEREPSKLTGWYGPAREFSFMKEVQPVFDKNCVSCHDYGKKAGKKLNLAGDRSNFFNTSYTDLWYKKYITSIGAGPAQVQQPYSWGSHTSKLVKVILSGHKGIKLDKESFDRIVTWIDINGPYYPYFATAYPKNLAGRSPLDDNQLRRLSKLTGVNIRGMNHFARNHGAQVTFDRPELSPCLGKFEDHNDPNYIEAVAIITAGKNMLERQPRADMPGFQPCKSDQKQQRTYTFFREAEMKSRAELRRKNQSAIK